MTKLSDLLKNTLLLLILLYIAPILITIIKNQYHTLLDHNTKVGVICIHEPVYEAQRFIHALTKMCKDPEIKAILLTIHCAGGHPGAAQALYHEIRALKKEYGKTIGTYIENVGTSSGYYIAAATDFIVATPAAFIGNIGIYIKQPQLKDFINEHKINYSVTQTGTHRTVGDMFLEQTEQGQKMLQTLTDEIYQQFIHDIIQARPQLLLEKAHEWADGKTVTGATAVKLGLIDLVGSRSTAELLLRKCAPIDGDIVWIYSKNTTPIVNSLLNAEHTSHTESIILTLLHRCISFVCSMVVLPY